MPRQTKSETRTRTRRPATTPEAREAELSSDAYDLAEEQLKSGTASSQVITFFLKAGSMRERLEQERMRHEIELMEVKKEAMERQDRMDDLFSEAINAMRRYSGREDPDDIEHGPP